MVQSAPLGQPQREERAYGHTDRPRFLCVNVGCYAPGSSKNERPAAANGLEKLRRHLLLPSRLSAGLRPIDLLLGLRYYVYSVATLQALHIFSVHVPVSVDVTLTPGTCLEINHRA